MILLFPFGLTADQIVWWGFIATVVAAVCAIWGGVASTAAAKYAKDAPSKADFKRLEEHAAITSQYHQGQARREDANIKASRIHVSIRGRSPQNEDLLATIEVQNPEAGLRLSFIDFISKDGTSYGSTQIKQVGASTYKAWLDRVSVQRWYDSEKPGEFNLRIRVHMIIEEEPACRDLPVTVSQARVQLDTQSPEIRPCWFIQGDV